jgi:hypothetical protein
LRLTTSECSRLGLRQTTFAFSLALDPQRVSPAYKTLFLCFFKKIIAMLQILNKTPFEAALALVTDQNGAEKVSVAVKGTFKIPPRYGEVGLADEQLPVLYTNEYYGEPGKSSIKYPVDIVLGKVNTDIGLIGMAHSPQEKLVKRLLVSLKVGQMQKVIMVTGDRYWKKRALLPGFYMTDPIPFKEMPLIYERSFGGMDQTHKNEKKHGGNKSNPIGTGFRLNRNMVVNHRLPNLQDPNHLISHWQDKPPVACYGFVDSSWEPRIKFAGTCDEFWLNNHFPLLPIDFDLRFFNAAPPELIAKGILKGGEPVKMVNLSKKGVLEFNLPKLEISLMFRLGETRNHTKADIWTVVFEPDEDRFYIVWGGTFCVGKQPSRMKYVKVEMHGEPGTINLLKANSAEQDHLDSIGKVSD